MDFTSVFGAVLLFLATSKIRTCSVSRTTIVDSRLNAANANRRSRRAGTIGLSTAVAAQRDRVCYRFSIIGFLSAFRITLIRRTTA